jgi:hypothetical protein
VFSFARYNPESYGEKGIGFDVVDRYEAKFYRRVGFHDQAEWIRRWGPVPW